MLVWTTTRLQPLFLRGGLFESFSFGTSRWNSLPCRLLNRARVGGLHLFQLTPTVRYSGCITRQRGDVVLRRSGEIHRPQFRSVNCVVHPMPQGWLLAACKGLRS